MGYFVDAKRCDFWEGVWGYGRGCTHSWAHGTCRAAMHRGHRREVSRLEVSRNAATATTPKRDTTTTATTTTVMVVVGRQGWGGELERCAVSSNDTVRQDRAGTNARELEFASARDHSSRFTSSSPSSLHNFMALRWQCSQVVTASRLGLSKSVMGFPREFESRHCQWFVPFGLVFTFY